MLGNSNQPNLEKILKLNPNLIIGIYIYGEPILGKLSQIAPTALGKWKDFSSWREHFDFVAHSLGKEKKAEEVWDHYRQRTADIRTALGENLQSKKVSFIYAHSGVLNTDTIKNSFSGGIFADIGIRQPDYAIEGWDASSLSEELIPTIDADILFVGAWGDVSAQSLLDDWQQKPLWKQLKAVQAGQVYLVDGDIWLGGNPIAANLVIDDLFKYLVKKQE